MMTRTMRARRGRESRRANGPLMARPPAFMGNEEGPAAAVTTSTWAFAMERVTRIELALSTWESVVSAQLEALSCAFGYPRVTLIAQGSPTLMASQWRGDLVNRQVRSTLFVRGLWGPRGLTASHPEGLASCRQPCVSAADGSGRDDALEKCGRLAWSLSCAARTCTTRRPTGRSDVYRPSMDIDWNAEMVDQLERRWQHQLRPPARRTDPPWRRKLHPLCRSRLTACRLLFRQGLPGALARVVYSFSLGADIRGAARAPDRRWPAGRRQVRRHR